jgi:hypothetical protein
MMQTIEGHEVHVFFISIKFAPNTRAPEVAGLVCYRFDPFRNCPICDEYWNRFGWITSTLRSQIPGENQRSPQQSCARRIVGCWFEMKCFRKHQRHRVAVFPGALELDI